MTSLEQTNQHLLGAWKLESPFWTKNSLRLQWLLIQSGKRYGIDIQQIGFSFQNYTGFFTMLFNIPFQIKPGEGRMEKWILRKAFDDEEHPYLPKVLHIIISFHRN
jgi:hypothetical protein